MAAADVPRALDGRVLPDVGHTRPCHYTLLGLDFTCDALAVKKSFRKTALQWHPDKNRSEHASDYFKLLQEAYETLSDPQERAWYDAHRETILRGRNPGDESDDEGDGRLVNVFEYFSVSCFDGFGDDEGGFFAVFGGTFAAIYKEELRFSEALNAARAAGTASAADIPPAAPAFGKSDTDPDDVLAFYNHWAIFSSGMTFMWEDKYHTADAPDRWVKRKMESENKRLRKAARQKRGEEVRQLVAWVRKRDPRMRAALAAAAAAEKARLAEIAAKQAAHKSRRAQRIQEELQQMEEAYEEQEDYEAERDTFLLAEEDGDDERRRRKKQSKKKSKGSKAAKGTGGGGQQDGKEASQSSDHSDSDAAGGAAGAAGAGDAIEGGDATSDEEGGVDDVLLGLIGGAPPSEDVRGRRKGPKKSNKPAAAAAGGAAADGGDVSPALGRSKKKKGKKNKKRGMVMGDPTGGIAALDSDEEGVSALGVPLPPGQLDDSDSDGAPPAAPGAPVASASGHSEPSKAEKRAARRAKRKAKAASKEGGTGGAAAKTSGGGDASTDCAVCGASFGTRNKLFTHIKKTGHAALK